MVTKKLSMLIILLTMCTIINRTLSISVYHVDGETENKVEKGFSGSSGTHTGMPLNLLKSAKEDDGQEGEKDLGGKGKHPLDRADPESVGVTMNILDVVKGSVEDQVIAEVPPEFLSITVSPLLTQHHWSTFNTSSPRLKAISRALSPAILRMGGSAANFVTYEPDARQRQSLRPSSLDNDFATSSREDEMSVSDDNSEGPTKGEHVSSSEYYSASHPCDGDDLSHIWTNFTMFEDDWVRLNEFVKTVGWQLLFDLNQFYRDPEGNWDPSNALMLFKSAQDKGQVDILWQLGNEPGAYKHHFNFSITGKQMAQDVLRLRNELKNKFPEMYNNTLIVGPDTTRPKHLKSEEVDVVKEANLNGHEVYNGKGEVQLIDNAGNGFPRSDFENKDKNRIPSIFSSGAFDTTQPQHNSKKNTWDALEKSLKISRKTIKEKVHENSIHAAFLPAFSLFKHYRIDNGSMNDTKEIVHKQEKSDGLGYGREFNDDNDTKADFSRETRETSNAQVGFQGFSEEAKSEGIDNGETRETGRKQFDDSKKIKETINEEENNDAELDEANHGRSVFNIKPETGAQYSKKVRRSGTNSNPDSAQGRELREGGAEERADAESQRETEAGGCLDVAGEDEEGATVGTDSMEFLKEFLEHVGNNIDVVSWHQYYFNGRTAQMEDFLSPEVLDLFARELEIVVALRNRLAPEKPIWLTETGSAWGGGAPNLSNRFAASFMYLDKLGVAAEGGASVVARQTFYSGHYAMIGVDLIPNPDFWVAVLHKRLVGQKVLRFSLADPDPNVRLYASCAANHTSYYRSGAVVVYGVNLSATEVEVRLQGRFAASAVFQFLLQPAFGKLTDRDIELNGRPIELVNDTLPDLGALETPPGSFLIPPHSLGFWLLRDAHTIACY